MREGSAIGAQRTGRESISSNICGIYHPPAGAHRGYLRPSRHGLFPIGRKPTSGTVYLLHFSDRTVGGHQHYLGWTTDVAKRLARHRAGRGAKETKRAVAEGLKLKLAQTWRGTPADERRIKDERKRVRRSFGCLCPYCGTEDELAADLVRGMGPPELRIRHLDSEGAGRTSANEPLGSGAPGS